MHDLILRSLQAYQAAPPAVRIEPSIPILYFGDRAAYEQSRLRIITVGLNPSLAEFPKENPFCRFPAAQHDPSDPAAIETALNEYFERDAYHSWFKSFETILLGFSASFYRDRHQAHRPANRALHTDLLSPVATDPTWSRLTLEDRNTLLASGLNLWHELVERLAPDLMLISVAGDHLDNINFPNALPWEVVHTVDHKRIACNIKYARYQLPTGHLINAIFGTAAQTPFGFFNGELKGRIAGIVDNHMHYRMQPPILR